MAKSLELKELLEAGAHFGHQTHKWNPKMKPYVYGERNGIYVIDLQQTLPMAKKAYDFIKKTASSGKSVLFVGTKRQASSVVREAAENCGAYHVTNRWLGGMLTNYKTISLSIDKLRKVEKDVIKLEKNLGGIKNMRKLPGAIVIVDPNSERIAVKEANLLNIPVIAVTDTNCDPEGIDYIVPGNDDAIKSITLFTDYFSQAVAEGGKGVKKDSGCLLYTSDAADDSLRVDLGGRRIIKKT